MKNTIKITAAFVLTLFVAAIANAQVIPNGTVSFNVSVSPSVDIRSGGTGTTTGSVGASTITASTQTVDAALGTTLTVTDASPNTSNAPLTASVPIRLRGNAPYTLQATRSGSSTTDPSNFDSSDIAMSLSFSARSGAQVNLAGTDNTVGFGGNVGALTALPATIGNGSYISNQGNTVSPDNFVAASLDFSIARQFYQPVSGYTDTVTISIVTP